MAGQLRRLLQTVPLGCIDVGQVAALAARVPGPRAETFTPAAALARGLLTTYLAGSHPERCRVLGPGRLVSAETLPVDCWTVALGDVDLSAIGGGAELDWLVVGDALAAADDPPAVLAEIASSLLAERATRLLVILPGTALLPDDEPHCPRRWLFSPVSAEAMARRVLAGRPAFVVSLGNVLAASMELLGFTADRLWPNELTANDAEYPMVVAIVTGRP